MKRIALLLFIALSQLLQPVQAQTPAPSSYTYMQIFYYGPKTTPGFAFMSFAPSFHNQMDVRIDEPSAYAAMFGPILSEGTHTVTAEVTNIDNQKAKIEDPKYKAAMKVRQEKDQQNFEKQIETLEKRAQKMRDMLLKTLNAATAEGWEVVQMSSYGDSGLVYLLRRAK